MKKQNKKFLIAIFSIAIIGIAITALAGYYAGLTWTKTYRLNDQYIASIDPQRTQGLVPCDRCLIMDVQDEWWAKGGCWRTQNYTFFFANEHQLRDDLQVGDMIEVRWKWVDGDRLIRGVQKANE